MPTQVPIASFLIPVYNGEAFLAEALESALAQTETNIEVVVVDDGSQDSTRAILRHFAARDSRIRVFEEEHRGLIAALNRGLAVARGKYICRLDADDIATPDRVEKQVAFLERNPDYILVGGQVTFIDMQGKAIGAHHQSLSADEVEAGMKKANLFAHSSVLFRRAEALDAGSYDPLFIDAEDYEFWIRLAANHRLGNLPDVVCLYRMHEHQITSVRHLRQCFTMNCILAKFRGASREAIRDNVRAEEEDFIPALRRLGYSNDEIAQRISGSYFVWVAQLNSASNRQLALKLLSELENHLKRMNDASRYLAQAYSWEFVVSFRAHRFLRSARSLFQAFVLAPAKTTRNIFSRLSTPLSFPIGRTS